MALAPRDAIRILEDCLGRVATLIEVAGDAARIPQLPQAPDRLDLYALITLGEVRELAAGVLDERRAGRRTNAVRLARHLFEYDVESAWVTADPKARVKRAFGEEMRRLCEEVPAERTAHMDLSVARAFVDEVRGGLSRRERGNYGELLPSRKVMAEAVGALETYHGDYAEMSWLAHPGLTSGTRFLRLVDDHGELLAAPTPDYGSEVAPMANGAFSATRCYRRLVPEIGVPMEDAKSREILTTIDGITRMIALGE